MVLSNCECVKCGLACFLLIFLFVFFWRCCCCRWLCRRQRWINQKFQKLQGRLHKIYDPAPWPRYVTHPPTQPTTHARCSCIMWVGLSCIDIYRFWMIFEAMALGFLLPGVLRKDLMKSFKKVLGRDIWGTKAFGKGRLGRGAIRLG